MSNNKQQTAVEWFHQKTWALKIQLEKGEISIGEYANTYATLYEQAKEMEKEKHRVTAQDFYYGSHSFKNFEQYYDEIYGNNHIGDVNKMVGGNQ